MRKRGITVRYNLLLDMFYGRIGERSRLARRMRFTFTPGASAEDFSPDIRPRSHDRLLSTLDIRLLSPGACRVFHSFDFAIFDCGITISGTAVHLRTQMEGKETLPFARAGSLLLLWELKRGEYKLPRIYKPCGRAESPQRQVSLLAYFLFAKSSN